MDRRGFLRRAGLAIGALAAGVGIAPRAAPVLKSEGWTLRGGGDIYFRDTQIQGRIISDLQMWEAGMIDAVAFREDLRFLEGI